MAAPSRYGVKTATLTFASGTYEMAAGPAGKTETKDAIDVTSLTDTIKRYIPGAVKDQDEFTVTLYQKGSGDITADAAPGAGAIAVSLENGGTNDVSVSVSFPTLIVTKVSYPNIDASGDRKATYDVTFRPDGSTSSSNVGGN